MMIKREPLILFSFFVTIAAFAQSSRSSGLDALIIEMEPYIVRADRVLPEPESWLYIKIPTLVLDRETNGKRQDIAVPGYEMLFSGTEKDARLFSTELQLRQVAGAVMFPAFTRLLPKEGVIVVHNEHYPKLDGYTVNPNDDIWGIPHREEKGALGTKATPSFDAKDQKMKIQGTMTMSRHNRIVIYFTNPAFLGQKDPVVMNGSGQYFDKFTWEAHCLWASLNASSFDFAQERHGRERPWLRLGLDFLLRTLQVDNKRMGFGKITSRRRETPPVLSDLLTSDGTKYWGRNFTMHAGIFIHYGLFGKNGANREKFMTLVEDLEKNSFSEELFQKAWGRSTRQIRGELISYVEFIAQYQTVEYKGKLPEMPPVVLREATQSEIARLKTELFMSRRQVPDALDELRIAYLRGGRDPVMLAMLASLEQRIGSEERARKLVKALMALPRPPPQTHIVAARLRFKEMLAAKPSGEKLNTAESSELIAILSGALAGGLTSEELCGTLAEIVLKSAERPDANTAGFLSEAAKRYPFNKTIAEALKIH